MYAALLQPLQKHCRRFRARAIVKGQRNILRRVFLCAPIRLRLQTAVVLNLRLPRRRQKRTVVQQRNGQQPQYHQKAQQCPRHTFCHSFAPPLHTSA